MITSASSFLELTPWAFSCGGITRVSGFSPLRLSGKLSNPYSIEGAIDQLLGLHMAHAYFKTLHPSVCKHYHRLPTVWRAICSFSRMSQHSPRTDRVGGSNTRMSDPAILHVVDNKTLCRSIARSFLKRYSSGSLE